MAETKIQWTWRRNPKTGSMMPGYTFNPWIGCTKVSPACKNCYAEALDARRFAINPATGGTPDAPVSHWGPGAPRYRVKDWSKPRTWNRAAAKEGYARAVFCASLADWADEEVPTDWLVDLLTLVRECRNLDWLMLTKRNPGKALQRAIDHLNNLAVVHPLPVEEFNTLRWLQDWLMGEPPANVWLGATMEDQKHLDERLGPLLDVPAVVHFASMEPLLGPVVIPEEAMNIFTAKARPNHALDWVIAGGESNEREKENARPVHPDEALAIAAQCWANGVPFFWKQWGEWAPAYELDHNPQAQAMCAMEKVPMKDLGHGEGGRRYTYLVGVDMAGNLFDGKPVMDQPRVREILTT